MRRKKLYLLVTVLAILALTAVAYILFHAAGKREQQGYLEKANAMYAAGDYENALLYLRRLSDSEEQPGQETVMLMADCYEALGNYQRAVELLRRMNTGDPAIAERIRSIEEKRDMLTQQDTVTVAGTEFARNTREAKLDGRGITDEQLKEVTALYALDDLSLRDNGLTDIRLLASLGGLDFLDLSGNRIRDISALAKLRELRRLNLNGNPIEDYSPLYSLSGLNTLYLVGTGADDRQLTELAAVLTQCAIRCELNGEEQILLGSLRFRTDVEQLSLENRGIQEVGALAECTALKSLNLKGNSIADVQPLMSLGELSVLDLSGNSVSDLLPLIGLPNLKELDASDNLVADTSAVGSIEGLKTLDLSGNRILDFSGLGRLSRLENLSLRDTGIRDADLEALLGLKNLRTLDLRENKGLSNLAVGQLESAIPGCSVLCSELVYEVEFCGHQVRSDETFIAYPNGELEAVTGLERMTSLEELDLSGNQIIGLFGFSISPSRNTLKILNLADNQIRDISDLGELAAVEELDLSGNRIESVRILSRLTTLKVLNLSGNPVVEDQLLELQQALPGCRVIYG